MRFNYLNWIIAGALLLVAFALGIFAIGYQPVTLLRALTVLALLAIAGIAYGVKRKKTGDR